jgi:hypothetical protein
MTHLSNFLSPKGIAVGTTLGRWGNHAYEIIPYIGEDRWQNVTKEFELSGYGYSDYPPGVSGPRTPGLFGISLASPSTTLKDIEDIPGVRIYSYQERGWADHQDVLVFGRPSYDEPWEIMRQSSET